MSDVLKKTLLLVEDQNLAAEIISMILKKSGFDVIIANSGEEAISIVSSGQLIHLILMDIVLGNGMDGIEAARIILQDHDIPLIFLSGHTEPEIVKKTETVSSYGYILKNSDQSILIASIKMALNLYEARQKIRQQEDELKQNEWFKQIVFETISDGIITVDENGKILFVNNMLENIFGYPSSELLGRNLTLLIPAYLRDHHSRSLNDYIRSGQRHLPSWSGIHVPGLHKEGFEISLEISFGENRFEGQRVFCGIIRDITEKKQAENSLKESETAFRAMFSGNPIPMWVYDSKTLQFLEVNNAAVKHYGYSRDEFLTITIRDIRPPEDMEKLKQLVPKLPEESNKSGVWTHLKKDGTAIHVEITSHPIEFSGRKARLVLANDVTERIQAENVLIKSEIAFRAMFSGNPIPMLVYEPETLKILEVNNMAISHYGYSRDEFLSMTVSDIRPPEDIPKLLKKVSELGKGISKTGVWRHLKRDGTLIYVEITSHSLDYLGKNARLVLANDVTERIHAEAKLQQQYSILQGIIESADAFVFSLDQHWHYTSFNKSHADMMKLLNDEDIEIGKNILDYIRDEKEREIVKQNIDRALQGNFFVTEHPISAYPGLCLEVFLNPIRSDSGSVVGAAVFARDISERKHAENDLKESEAVFRLMFTDNPIPMWIYDSETLRFLEVNDAAVKHYGYRRDEFSAMTVKDIRQPQDSGIPDKSEIGQHRRKDGSVIYVESTSQALNFWGKQARLVLANDVTERIVSQQKLTESRERLTLALQGAKAGVWEWNVIEKKMFWTDENYRLMGLEPEEIAPCYRSWINSVHPEDRDYAQSVLVQAFENCDRFDIEYRIILPGGIIRWIRNIGYAELDSIGEPRRMIGLQIDITERKHAEQQLSEQYSILKGVIESMDAAIFSLDKAFCYTSFNTNHACIMKSLYDTDIGIGKNILDCMTNEEDRKEARQNIERTLSGRQFTTETYSGEESLLRQYFEVSHAPVKRDDKIFGVVVLAKDMTERKLAEIKILESEKKYRRIVDTANEGIIILDENFKITFANARMAAMIGYSVEDMTGKYFEEFVFEEDKISQQEEFLRRKQGDPGFYERRLCHKDNFAVCTIISATPITDENHHFIGSFGMFTDITERKKAEDTVKQQNEFLNNVINALSHPFYVVDADTYKIQIANKASRIPPGTDITCHELTHQLKSPCESPECPCAVKEVRKTKKPVVLEHLHYDSDGKPMYVEVHAHPISDADGNVLQVIEYAIDITERKKKDSELRVSLEKYRLLFESFPLGITITDPFGKLLETNRKSEELLGVSKEEHARRLADDEKLYIIRSDGSLMPPEEYASIRALREQRVVENVEMGIVKKDGSITWISVTAAPIPLEGYGVAITYSDITARKQAEFMLQKLRDELEHLVDERTAEIHDLYNNAPCGYHSLNADGLIVLMNDTELKWLGYTREEIVGRRTFDQIICNPKIFIENFPVFKKRGWVKDLEFRMIRKDGSVFPALLSATAIYDSDGKYLMSRSTMFDITEFKKIEQKLRESEERFRVAIKNSPLMVFMQDKDLRYTWAYNQHPAFSAEEIIGKTDDELLPESAAVMNKIKRIVLKTGQGIRREVSIVIKGKIFFHDLTVEPLIDSSDQIVGVVSASMNITTHKLLEEKLRQRSEELCIANIALEKTARLKDEFLASMSHELRTPLTGVISLSEALLEEVYGSLNEKQFKTIRTIESSGQHLLDLITDILDLSKIEAGQMELQPEKSSVSDICQSALQLTKGMANKKRHKIFFSMNPASMSIYADPRRLKQMLVNLLSNAIKFTPEGGEIALDVREDETEHLLCFSVRDTGIGIAPEMFPMLFKPFVQLDSSLSRRYSGTGLGLSLVRRMAELHGGGVTLESELGRGSCFTISLPSITSAQELSENSETEISDEMSDRQTIDEEKPSEALILLVEDNEINISIYSDYLQIRGYRVQVARNGREGIEKAKELQPDLILMDIQMPDVDGLEATRILRSDTNPKVASTPIIALTSLAMPGDREKCIDSGADEYLSKPVSLKHFIEIIKKHINKD